MWNKEAGFQLDHICHSSAGLENTLAVVDSTEEISKHQRDDCHQLHQDVEGRAGGVLERVSNCIANNSGLVHFCLLAMLVELLAMVELRHIGQVRLLSLASTDLHMLVEFI